MTWWNVLSTQEIKQDSAKTVNHSLPAEQITVKEAHPQNVSWDIASVTHLPVLRYSGGVKAKLVL